MNERNLKWKKSQQKIRVTIKGTLLLTGLLMIAPVLTQAKSADKPPIEVQYEQRKYVSITMKNVGTKYWYESAGYKGYLYRSTRSAYEKMEFRIINTLELFIDLRAVVLVLVEDTDINVYLGKSRFLPTFTKYFKLKETKMLTYKLKNYTDTG